MLFLITTAVIVSCKSWEITVNHKVHVHVKKVKKAQPDTVAIIDTLNKEHPE